MASHPIYEPLPHKKDIESHSLSSPPPSCDDETTRLEQQDIALKHRVRRLRIGVRILDLGCSYPSTTALLTTRISVLSLSTHNLIIYNQTRNATINGSPIWLTDPKIWPTKVMIAVGSISLFLASMVLLSYFWGTKYANRMATVSSVIGVGVSVFKIVMFAVAGSLFLGASRGIPDGGRQSLWSISCNADDASKAVFSTVVDLGQFCAMQHWQLNCSFIGIGLEVFTVITYVYVLMVWIVVMKRMRHKIELRKRSIGVWEVKGLEGRLFSLLEKSSEKQTEKLHISTNTDIVQ